MGKGPFSALKRSGSSSTRRRKQKTTMRAELTSSPSSEVALATIPAAQSPLRNFNNDAVEREVVNGGVVKGVVKKKMMGGGARLWMRFDKNGKSEVLECDKSVIIERVSIPPRDLRILGPVFSHSSNILGVP